jgi:dihydroflavonol-4-reductase
MKILLTGANGFVGSHVLDRLVAQKSPVVILLRPSSDRRFITRQISQVTVWTGSMDQPASLDNALAGVTHVIHCAGTTKAVQAADFFTGNQLGTRNLIAAVNRRGAQIERFVLISSLAAAGPATANQPKREQDQPAPVSDYGRSKLAAEREVSTNCKCDWTILRPPAVYGPRDAEFLRLFKAVKEHVRPSFGGGCQQLTLVFVEDLAAAIVTALTHPNASRKVFFVGSTEVVTAAELAHGIAAESGVWTIPLPLPNTALWIACQLAELKSRCTNKASVLNAQKWAELKAPGWVCDVARMHAELDIECRTSLHEGIRKSRDWYRAQGWL